MQAAPFLLAVLVLWIINLLMAIHFRKLGKMMDKQQGLPLKSAELPPASIIITTHNQATELRQNLPLFLEQAYPNDYEVIVVDRHSDDETISLLESLEESYPHLHHTYCPTTARDISLQRLALTLGIKSACYEWTCITQADCRIPDEHWLTNMMQPCCEEIDAILGLTRFEDAKGWASRRWQFFKLWQQMMWLPFAEHHAPYRADGSCLCYRKSVFMKHQGFASHSNLVSGAETLLVNHNVHKGRCHVNVRPGAIVTQQLPIDRMWSQERLFYMETRQHMKHYILYRLRYFMATCANFLYFWLTLALMLWFVPNWYTVAPLGLMWLILLMVKLLAYNFTARRVGSKSLYFTLPLLLSLIPLWDAEAWFRWLFTRKKTFRKKFV